MMMMIITSKRPENIMGHCKWMKHTTELVRVGYKFVDSSDWFTRFGEVITKIRMQSKDYVQLTLRCTLLY